MGTMHIEKKTTHGYYNRSLKDLLNSLYTLSFTAKVDMVDF